MGTEASGAFDTFLIYYFFPLKHNSKNPTQTISLCVTETGPSIRGVWVKCGQGKKHWQGSGGVRVVVAVGGGGGNWKKEGKYWKRGVKGKKKKEKKQQLFSLTYSEVRMLTLVSDSWYSCLKDSKVIPIGECKAYEVCLVQGVEKDLISW